MMRALAILLTALTLAGAAVSHATGEKRAPRAPQLSNAAPSTDALIREFLLALERKDLETLRKLRVDEDEYVDVILKGSVPEGQSLRDWPRETSAYFFRDLETKSRYSEQRLIGDFGGRSLRLESVEFEKGTKRYANHVAHRQLRLSLRDERGEEARLATGSIAEVNGQCKFISYVAD